MKNLFEQSRSHWVRYDRYELKTAADGKRYVTPAKDAKPDVYNPMKEMPGMVLDALNVGMLMMGRRTDVDVETARNAGVACCAVSWGFRSVQCLRDAGAARIAANPQELLAMLEAL